MKKLMMFAAALACAAACFAGTTTIVPPPYGQAQAQVPRMQAQAPVKAEAVKVTVQTATNAAAAWTAPITVTQTAASVRINNIQINILPDNKIVIMVSWSWLDAQSKAVRAGVTRYLEQEIAAKLQAKGASVEQFRQLFLAIATEEALAP